MICTPPPSPCTLLSFVATGDRYPTTTRGRVLSILWMIVGLLIFAMVAGSLTNEVIIATTDHTIHSLKSIGAGSRIGAFGEAYYATEHVIFTQTQAESFEACNAQACIEALLDNKFDAVIGPYASILEARRVAAEASGRSPTAAPKIDDKTFVYVAGDEFTSARMFQVCLIQAAHECMSEHDQ